MNSNGEMLQSDKMKWIILINATLNFLSLEK